MRLRKIELEGFRSFRDHEVVDLTGLNLTAIVGQNHQGKSTLVSAALAFAFFGRAPGATVKDAITRGENKATVTVEFDLSDATYRIIRSRTVKGRPEVYVSVSDPNEESGWRPLEEKYATSGADQFIVDLIGMDYPTARATWLIEQGDFASFAMMDPSPRREVLANAFGLQRFEPLAAAADEHRRKARQSLELAQYEFETLTARQESLANDGPYPTLSDDVLAKQAEEAEAASEAAAKALSALEDPELESRARAAQTALSEFDAAHQREVSRHEKEQARTAEALTTAQQALARAEAALAATQDAHQQFEQAQQAAAQAESNVATHEERMTVLRQQIGTAQQAAAAARAAQGSLKSAGVEIKARMDALRESAQKGQGECFTCRQPLSQEHVHDVMGGLERERQALLGQWNAKDTEAQQATAEAARLDQEGRAANAAAQQGRAQETQARQAAARAQAVLDSIPERKANRQTAAERVSAAENDVLHQGPAPQADLGRRQELAEAAARARQAYEEATREGAERRAALNQDREQARAKYRMLWQEQSRRQQSAQELEAIKEPLRAAAEATKKAEKEAEGYAILHQAYRPTGIPAMILATVIEELNEEANDILGVMGSDLGVNVTTQKETQRGTTQEKVMVYAMTADGPADFKTLSGQEQYFVALSLRLGLAACIARRTGKPVETIVQDEGWGALDEQNRKAVMDALLRISERFSVFSVTHVTEVKDAFPAVIEVSAETGTSRAQVVRR